MLRHIFSKPYSHLYIVGDNAKWAIDEEAKALEATARKLGIKVTRTKKVWLNLPQVVHYTSQFSLLNPKIYKSKHRISLDYFHGKPEQGESFKKCFEALNDHPEIASVRVSTTDMQNTLRQIVDTKKVHCIPIGIDLGLFRPQTAETRRVARERLNLPQDASVIGSFQKDGVGWGEGLEPKLIKGPDMFIEVVKKLKSEIPNLWVLLAGPSRGYVMKELEKIGVPYRHAFPAEYSAVSALYDALDLYLITSREEGGPKACLEAMAKGVPLVTTAVGQCVDLVKNGQNAMMAPIDDLLALSDSVLQIWRDQSLQKHLAENGLKTAEENSLRNQVLLWKEYFRPLINS